MGISDKLDYISETKSLLASAINATGLTMPADTPFREYADYIGRLTYVPPVTTGSLSVGSTVYLNESGTPVPYLVVHQGLPSSLYDSSCNGTWLLRYNCLNSSSWDTSGNNSYRNSYMNTSYLPTVFNRYDSDIQSVIKTVKIPYGAGGGTGTVFSGSNGLETNLFLISAAELGWFISTNSQFNINDGACLSYFYGLPVTNSPKRKAYSPDAGGFVEWWTRSPIPTTSQSVVTVNSSGNETIGQYPAYTYYPRPAMIMPQDLIVDDDGNVTAETV